MGVVVLYRDDRPTVTEVRYPEGLPMIIADQYPDDHLTIAEVPYRDDLRTIAEAPSHDDHRRRMTIPAAVYQRNIIHPRRIILFQDGRTRFQRKAHRTTLCTSHLLLQCMTLTTHRAIHHPVPRDHLVMGGKTILFPNDHLSFGYHSREFT